MKGNGLSSDKERPVKGKRYGVVTGNEGAMGGPNRHQEGGTAELGYAKKQSFPLRPGELSKREISGGEPS